MAHHLQHELHERPVLRAVLGADEQEARAADELHERRDELVAPAPALQEPRADGIKSICVAQPSDCLVVAPTSPRSSSSRTTRGLSPFPHILSGGNSPCQSGSRRGRNGPKAPRPPQHLWDRPPPNSHLRVSHGPDEQHAKQAHLGVSPYSANGEA